jgi:hypothetical protein
MSSSGTITVTWASSSRSGRTQFHPEIFDCDAFLIFFIFVYISNTCSFFIDFHVLALRGSSRAHHDVCLEKSIPTAPISSSVIKLDVVYIWWNVVVEHVTMFYHFLTIVYHMFDDVYMFCTMCTTLFELFLQRVWWILHLRLTICTTCLHNFYHVCWRRRLLNIVGYSTSSVTQHRLLLNIVSLVHNRNEETN